MKNKREQRKWFSMKTDSEKQKIDNLADVDWDQNINSDATPEFFLAAASLNDHYITKIVSERTKRRLSTTTQKESLVCDGSEWLEFIHKKYKNLQIVEYGNENGMIIDNDSLEFIDYNISSNLVEVKMYGGFDFVKKAHKEIVKKFTVAKCYIEWIYGGDGSSVNIPLLPEKMPITEMYPFLVDETIEEYYDRYLKSSASILLLIGPPGTGKTTFIRGLLNYAAKNAIVTYDEKILERDYIFARFIEDEVGVMVIEDADNFLKSRADGNTMMHRFLNVGDGLISLKGKKLIFSTNLPSISDVDSALVRPGRCFDIVSFDNYSYEQAVALANKLGVEFDKKDGKSDTYSLAEIFHKQRNSSPKQTRKMGFV